MICKFSSIEDQFNFGKYNGLSLADVMDTDPSYLEWCVKYCTSVIFLLEDTALLEIKKVYPNFLMDYLFESKRIMNLLDDDFNGSEDEIYDNMPVYENYSGSWAQDIEGYSDDDIDTIFDGDPSAYWNID